MDKKFKFKLDKDKIKLQLEKLGKKLASQKKHSRELLVVFMIFVLLGLGFAISNRSNNREIDNYSLGQNDIETPNIGNEHEGKDSILSNDEEQIALDYSAIVDNQTLRDLSNDDGNIGVFTEPLKPRQDISTLSQGISLIKPVSGNIFKESGWYYHSLLGDWRYQSGIQFEGQKGDIVMASASGEVIAIKEDDYKGIVVLIEHEQGWLTEYGYLQRASVSVGNNVSKGQEIGRVGNTGMTKEPALYFSLQNGDDFLTPLDFFE
ncbi:peptidoglycan DD-metalloendopeptidase family protein [Natronospora cellulosivora (SeqCode)]